MIKRKKEKRQNVSEFADTKTILNFVYKFIKLIIVYLLYRDMICDNARKPRIRKRKKKQI